MPEHPLHVRARVHPADPCMLGVESMMNQAFVRAGYKANAPSAWLNTSRALRVTVPCAPLGDYLALFNLTRVDAFWLDVEGAEARTRPRDALNTMPPCGDRVFGCCCCARVL